MEYYNSIAKGYNELHGKEQQAKLEVIRNELEERGLNKKSELLDVGCGTCMSADFFPCITYGVEPSEELVKQHSSGEGFIKNGRVYIAGAEELDKCFPEKKFDFIICVTVAHHFHDPQKAFALMKNALKENGTAVFSLLKGTADETEKYIRDNFKVLKKIGPSAGIRDTILVCKAGTT